MLALPAFAQSSGSTVTTLPSLRQTTNASGTIAVTDTFQSIWAAQNGPSAPRTNCLIQNNDSNNMWVYFGPIASATKATSVVLAPGQALNCATSGIVATSQVSITGTATGTFYAGLEGAPIVLAPTTVTTNGSTVEQDVNITEVAGQTVTPTVTGALPISQSDQTASGSITTQNLVPTGTATAGSAVELTTTGIGTVTIQVGGTYTGALSPQVTTDGTTWVTQAGNGVLLNMTTGTATNTIGSGSTGIWQIEVNGHAKFRITGLAAMTGTATIALRGAAGTSQVAATVLGSGLTSTQVQGSSASAATDVGAPVKIGGVAKTTLDTLSAGQRGDLAITLGGAPIVAIGGVNAPGADALSNNNIVFPLSTSQGAALATTRSGLSTAGLVFNGSTWDREFTCSNSAVVNVTAAATTQLVALSSSTNIRVCSVAITMSAAGTAQFVSGTGANCGTGTANVTGAFTLATGTPLALSAANGSLFRAGASNALCLTAVTGNVTGVISYAQF